MEEQSGWCLARADVDALDGFVPVLGDLGLVDLELDPDHLTEAFAAVRLYGLLRLRPGQLEHELAQDAWFVADAEPDDPFLAGRPRPVAPHPRPPGARSPGWPVPRRPQPELSLCLLRARAAPNALRKCLPAPGKPARLRRRLAELEVVDQLEGLALRDALEPAVLDQLGQGALVEGGALALDVVHGRRHVDAHRGQQLAAMGVQGGQLRLRVAGHVLDVIGLVGLEQQQCLGSVVGSACSE